MQDLICASSISIRHSPHLTAAAGVHVYGARAKRRGGPACGATGVQKDLVKYLPAPLVGFDGEKYFLDYETVSNPCAVGKVREWYGVAPVVLKAYCWIRSLGPNGLYQVAKTAVLNNNYMFKKLMELPEVSAYY